MSEKTSVNQPLMRLLKSLHPIRIENSFGAGIPDINFSHGWIECKYLKSYPKKETTPVRLDHPYTDDQKRFAEKRERAGGKVWLVVKVSKDWYIFEYPNSLLVGTITKKEMEDKCLIWFKNEPKWYQLTPVFTGRYVKDYAKNYIDSQPSKAELQAEMDDLITTCCKEMGAKISQKEVYSLIDSEEFPWRGSPLESKISQTRFLLDGK